MIDESLDVQFAATFDERVTVPAGSPEMLMVLLVQLPHVIVTACAPTVTESVPLIPLNVAVTVTGVVVF
jgi:hypothetical protein